MQKNLGRRRPHLTHYLRFKLLKYYQLPLVARETSGVTSARQEERGGGRTEPPAGATIALTTALPPLPLAPARAPPPPPRLPAGPPSTAPLPPRAPVPCPAPPPVGPLSRRRPRLCLPRLLVSRCFGLWRPAPTTTLQAQLLWLLLPWLPLKDCCPLTCR